MTIGGVLKALGRRWWALILAVALGAFWVVQVRAAPEVFWATTKVLLETPATPEAQRLAPTSSSLLALAGVLETAVNEGRTLPRPASADVTLVDQGIYDYSQVRVPNYGGQWANNFTQPALIVEAAGPSEDVVRQRITTLIDRVEAQLAVFQDASAVPSDMKITLFVFPSPAVQHNGGRRTAAVALIGVLVLAAGCCLAVGLDRVLPRRIRRQSATSSGSNEARARASAYVRRSHA